MAAVLSEIDLLRLETRAELLEVGAVLDALALSCRPGPYRLGEDPYEEDPEPADAGVDLRTDAAGIAEQLVAYDRIHGGGTTACPPAHPGGDRDTERDMARAYLRREWIAFREGFFPSPASQPPPS
ncbi:hypothetical protein WDV06_23560 [Streptomyces racemochromogenes]|uniref:Uncharacterized protein n=1 Tax=Streptomyces racemochromogenes TaxID=67353 RepID=A0ABW7PIT8_9ACTN